MLGQFDARVFLISLQGRLERSLKMSGLCLVGHLAGREEMKSLGESGRGDSETTRRWVELV